MFSSLYHGSGHSRTFACVLQLSLQCTLAIMNVITCDIYLKVATILSCSSKCDVNSRVATKWGVAHIEQIRYVQLSGTVKWVHHL